MKNDGRIFTSVEAQAASFWPNYRVHPWLCASAYACVRETVAAKAERGSEVGRFGQNEGDIKSDGELER